MLGAICAWITTNKEFHIVSHVESHITFVTPPLIPTSQLRFSRKQPLRHVYEGMLLVPMEGRGKSLNQPLKSFGAQITYQSCSGLGKGGWMSIHTPLSVSGYGLGLGKPWSCVRWLFAAKVIPWGVDSWIACWYYSSSEQEVLPSRTCGQYVTVSTTIARGEGNGVNMKL